MRIDVPSTNRWPDLNERCRAALSFQDPAVIVQAYLGLAHGLFESTHGLARLFSHKKTIAAVQPLEPWIESLLIGFVEDGYKLVRLTPEQVADPNGEWLSAIASDLLFVLFTTDDPVTGQIFNRDPLNDALKDKRIFRISVVHAPHELPHALTRPAPFKVRLLSLAEDLAIAVAGERFRVQPLLAHRLPWQDITKRPIELAPKSEQDQAIARQVVLDFESRLPLGFRAYFRADLAASRIFDRAVIYHPELDGSAICELLEGPERRLFDTTSPCRWNDPRFLDWLLKRGDDEAVIRGLITIDVSAIGPTLPERLAQAAEQLFKLQKG